MPIDRRQWTLAMIEASRATADKIGITPEAITAQAALESGWGRSAIGNNVFGIKAHAGWQGKTQTVRTREVINGQEIYIDDVFRDYDSLADCIADHFTFLDTNSRYRANGVFDAKGDVAYFQALQRAGYATDPNYAAILTNVLGTVKEIAGQKDDPAADNKPTPRTLRIGDIGDDVKLLQQTLNALADAMLDVDGVFGDETRTAVRHYQRNHGLAQDGIVGPQTRKSLAIWKD